MAFLDEEYWENRYENNDTGWDAGRATTPICVYADQLKDKNIKILIPGAGNAYEAEYFFKKGFHNVFVMDIAEKPLANFAARFPDFPKKNLIKHDFFLWSETYDLIIEQTFFCAIDPKLRPAYAKKTFELLNKGGKLTGLFFDKNFDVNPPFGGSKAEYVKLFSPYFDMINFSPCYNSISPRAGTEIFAIMRKRLFLRAQ